MAEYDRIQKKQESRAVAYNGGGSKQLKGFVDNSPNIAYTSSCKGINSPIQRMVIATAPVDLIDRIIAADIAFQESRAGGLVLTIKQIEKGVDKQFSINTGEWIIICGHGNGANIDGINSKTLSSHLMKIGNISKAGGIYLSACQTASRENPYIKQLNTHGISGMPIIGADGFKINDFDETSGEQQVAVKTDKEGVATKLQNKAWRKSRFVGDIGTPIKALSIDDVLQQGKQLLKDEKFRDFFKSFITSLQKSDCLNPDQLRDTEGRSINLIGEFDKSL